MPISSSEELIAGKATHPAPTGTFGNHLNFFFLRMLAWNVGNVALQNARSPLDENSLAHGCVLTYVCTHA